MKSCREKKKKWVRPEIKDEKIPGMMSGILSCGKEATSTPTSPPLCDCDIQGTTTVT